jgi:tetratricopeptide (TPR) repeat protein
MKDRLYFQIIIPLLIIVMMASNLSSTLGQTHLSLKTLREGNTSYKNKKYKDSEIKYRKAIENSPDYLKAKYNLGNALYKQGQYEEAAKYYQEVANHANVDKKIASAAWHNTGDVLLNNQKYRESMDAFKNAMILDPKSSQARYNYEYARQKLQQQKQQQQQQNQDQKQDQKQDKKQQKQEQKQDKKEDKQKQQKQQQRQQQNKKDMERQLNALNQNEKKTTEKLKKDKQNGTKSKFEKDW